MPTKQIIFKTLMLTLLLTLLGMQVKAQQTPQVIPLWQHGAPGYEHLKNEPEQAKDWWVRNIHNPSITLYHADKPNGSAILILPGGGHKELVFDEEGTKAARFLNKLGITTAVLKYRLFRETNSPYSMIHPTQDAIRAMRLLRRYSADWQIDANRIGIMGFSAGGEVVNTLAFKPLKGLSKSTDHIETYSAKANFHIQIYPGPLGIPDEVSPHAVPAFLLASNNDKCCSVSIFKLLQAYRKAGAPVEAHFYAKGDHGFNMGDRSQYQSIKNWPDRLTDWLLDNQFFK